MAADQAKEEMLQALEHIARAAEGLLRAGRFKEALNIMEQARHLRALSTGYRSTSSRSTGYRFRVKFLTQRRRLAGARLKQDCHGAAERGLYGDGMPLRSR